MDRQAGMGGSDVCLGGERRSGCESSTPIVPTRPSQRRLECAGFRVSIAGTNGNDFLVGTPGPDVIASAGGDDRVCGGGGSDSLEGGEGDDALLGGSGSDAVFGDQGVDRIAGGSGVDILFGGPGDDRIDGGFGNDFLSGEDGRDRLLPRLDRGYSALLQDLHMRGMLENTLVVWFGDFGRKPKINT